MLYVYVDRPDHFKLPAVFKKLSLHQLTQSIAPQYELLRPQAAASFARTLGDLAAIAQQADSPSLERVALGYMADGSDWRIIRWTATNRYSLRRIDYHTSHVAAKSALAYTQLASYRYDDLLKLSRIVAQSMDVVVGIDNDLLMLQGKHKSGRQWMAHITPDHEQVLHRLATVYPLSEAEGYKRVELRGEQLAEMVRRAQALAKEYKGTLPITRWSRKEVMIAADTPTSIRYRTPPYDSDWTRIDVMRADEIDTVSINSMYLPIPTSKRVMLAVPSAKMDIYAVARYVMNIVHLAWQDGDAYHHHAVMPLLPAGL